MMDSFAHYVHSPYSFDGPVYVKKHTIASPAQVQRPMSHNCRIKVESDAIENVYDTYASPSVRLASPPLTAPPANPVMTLRPSDCLSGFIGSSSPSRVNYKMEEMKITPPILSRLPVLPPGLLSPLYGNSSSTSSLLVPFQNQNITASNISPTSQVTLTSASASLISSVGYSTSPMQSARALAMSLIPSNPISPNCGITPAANPKGFVQPPTPSGRRTSTQTEPGLSRTISTSSTCSSITNEAASATVSMQSPTQNVPVAEVAEGAKEGDEEEKEESSPSLSTTPGCSHKKDWRRLRSKKGIGYYRCGFCGAKWKTPGLAPCANSTESNQP